VLDAPSCLNESGLLSVKCPAPEVFPVDWPVRLFGCGIRRREAFRRASEVLVAGREFGNRDQGCGGTATGAGSDFAVFVELVMNRASMLLTASPDGCWRRGVG
jgi:hypothetical protein